MDGPFCSRVERRDGVEDDRLVLSGDSRDGLRNTGEGQPGTLTVYGFPPSPPQPRDRWQHLDTFLVTTTQSGRPLASGEQRPYDAGTYPSTHSVHCPHRVRG